MLFAQIQGSARIRLEDGTILRVNYDSHNGWPYTPVGRVLVANKIMTSDQVSMQSIRDWMEANPDLAKDVRRQNKSYVFFRITDLATEDEAVGGEGVAAHARPLDRGRSCRCMPMARRSSSRPICRSPTRKRQRNSTGLSIAQDTGSAIVGPARADIYFGAGDEAARIAGRIKNPGDFVMLLPRALDPVEAGTRYAAAAGAPERVQFQPRHHDGRSNRRRSGAGRGARAEAKPAAAPAPKGKKPRQKK